MISCHLEVAHEKISVLEIVIVEEIWTLTGRSVLTDGSLKPVEIATSNPATMICGSATDQRVGKALEVDRFLQYHHRRIEVIRLFQLTLSTQLADDQRHFRPVLEENSGAMVIHPSILEELTNLETHLQSENSLLLLGLLLPQQVL